MSVEPSVAAGHGPWLHAAAHRYQTSGPTSGRPSASAGWWCPTSSRSVRPADDDETMPMARAAGGGFRQLVAGRPSLGPADQAWLGPGWGSGRGSFPRLGAG